MPHSRFESMYVAGILVLSGSRVIVGFREGSIRRSLSALVLMFAGIATAGGCGRGGFRQPGEVYDAGIVFARETPKITRTFQARNTTGKAVRIKGERHSCSCTTVEVKPQTLQSGDEIPLPVSVHVPHSASRQSVTVTLLTDHNAWGEWTCCQ